MGKKISCPGCGGELAFWGEVPRRHVCGLCGEQVKVRDEQVERLDLDNKPAAPFRRTRRPGAVE